MEEVNKQQTGFKKDGAIFNQALQVLMKSEGSKINTKLSASSNKHQKINIS